MRLSIVLLASLFVLGCNNPKKDLSADSCQMALVFMGLHVDLTSNPLGSKHDMIQDIHNARDLHKQCEESSDRLGLVNSKMTDERMVRMADSIAETSKSFKETLKSFDKLAEEKKAAEEALLAAQAEIQKLKQLVPSNDDTGNRPLTQKELNLLDKNIDKAIDTLSKRQGSGIVP